MRPLSVEMFFSNGLDDGVCEKFFSEFTGVNWDLMDTSKYKEVGLEYGWVNVAFGKSLFEACDIDEEDFVMKSNV